MRHVSRLSLSQSIPVLPFTVEPFASIGALIGAACLLEAFLSSDGCADIPGAISPTTVALTAHHLRGTA